MSQIVELGEEIYDDLMADKIYPRIRRAGPEAPRRRAAGLAGHRHPEELAQIIARRLGLTGALGTVADEENGVYTGRLFGEMLHGPAKAAAVRALAAREGLDLRRCTAYSDSVNDVPMLSVVGTAVAVNPDAALRDVARERGWQILDFRTGRKAAKIYLPAVLGVGAARRGRCWSAGRSGAGPADAAGPLTSRPGRPGPRALSPGTGGRGAATAGTGSAGSSPAPGRSRLKTTIGSSAAWSP